MKPSKPEQDNACEGKSGTPHPPLSFSSKNFTEVDSVDQALRLTVNGSPTTCGRPCSIAQLIELLKLTGAKGMAVAVNGRVIPAAHWGSHFLNDDDQVLIVHAVQGG